VWPFGDYVDRPFADDVTVPVTFVYTAWWLCATADCPLADSGRLLSMSPITLLLLLLDSTISS
jgi:hypothetical protein